MSDQKTNFVRSHFEELGKKWNSGFVAREKIGEFSGGAMTPGYAANLDCLKKGPPRLRIGRKIVYPILPLIEWMITRSTAL